MSFYKIAAPGSKVKFGYFTQWFSVRYFDGTIKWQPIGVMCIFGNQNKTGRFFIYLLRSLRNSNNFKVAATNI